MHDTKTWKCGEHKLDIFQFAGGFEKTTTDSAIDEDEGVTGTIMVEL